MFGNLFGGRAAGPRPGAVTPQEAQAKLAADPAAYLLDVREPSEFREARIEGAQLIPLGQLQSKLAELPHDREIVVVCRTGSRSGMAVGLLQRAGLNAFNLEGGLVAWARAGLPVRRG